MWADATTCWPACWSTASSSLTRPVRGSGLRMKQQLAASAVLAEGHRPVYSHHRPDPRGRNRLNQRPGKVLDWRPLPKSSPHHYDADDHRVATIARIRWNLRAAKGSVSRAVDTPPKSPRLGRWQQVLADAPDQNLAFGVRAAVADHLGRTPPRAALNAARRRGRALVLQVPGEADADVGDRQYLG
jgi:hypothetical protein